MQKYLYRSDLSEYIEKFTAYKQSLGFSYKNEIGILQQFDAFCSTQYDSNKLSKELIISWVSTMNNLKCATKASKVSVIRQFAIYMNTLDHKAYVFPMKYLQKPTRYLPYIFTEEQIAHMLNYFDNCEVRATVPNRHLALPILFRFLYCCGLRSCEVINLKLKNVDIKASTLIIIDSKFGKSRFVPINSRLNEMCTDYISRIHGSSNQAEYFFQSANGDRLTACNIRKNFRRYLNTVGLGNTKDRKGARVHDLRHTFAVHCLKKWIMEGKDLKSLLPVLKTYMGHSYFRYTEYYLRLTSDMYPYITDKVESHYSDVIPNLEVNFHEID